MPRMGTIRMRSTARGPDVSYDADKVYAFGGAAGAQIDEARARAFVAGGYAILLTDDAVDAPTTAAPIEVAVASPAEVAADVEPRRRGRPRNAR